jgi:hypothetical protein
MEDYANAEGIDMTQDKIIAMATQVYGECDWHKSALLRLEAFVKLVEDKAFQDGYEKGVAAFNEAVLIEREACAKVVLDNNHMFATFSAAKSLAEGIRARGEA